MLNIYAFQGVIAFTLNHVVVMIDLLYQLTHSFTRLSLSSDWDKVCACLCVRLGVGVGLGGRLGVRVLYRENIVCVAAVLRS